MATPLPVLIDLNIILDVVGGREPFKAASSEVLAAAELGVIEGFIAAHGITTFHYLASKHLSPTVAHIRLSDLLQFFKVAAVDVRVINGAMALPYKDFEDAVQMMAAVQAGCVYVVTRDREGFKMGPLPAISPGELLALIDYRE